MDGKSQVDFEMWQTYFRTTLATMIGVELSMGKTYTAIVAHAAELAELAVNEVQRRAQLIRKM
jgi:hypothetical protein